MPVYTDYAEEYLSLLYDNTNTVSTIHDAVTDIAHRGSGKGGYFNRYQLSMSRTDRYGHVPLTSNNETVGLTFFTRPKLNLTTSALRQGHSVMQTLDTLDNTSFPFAIRCMLDTKFAREGVAKNISKLCPWFDSDVPYINMLGNNLLQISGWPEFSLQTIQSEDGFFSENQTIAKGSDFLNQSYDLNVTFRDLQGGPVMALLYYWVFWIALLCRGDVTRYLEDTVAHRLSYTCSIYRFALDSKKECITSWSKATGCFPRAIPYNSKFDISDRTHFLSSLQEFTVPFTANHIEYMNPNTLRDFNTIMDQFGGPMYTSDMTTLRSDRIPLNNAPENNYKGIPYIDLLGGQNRLMWLATQDEANNNLQQVFTNLKNSVDQQTATIYKDLAIKTVDNGNDYILGYQPITNASYVVPTYSSTPIPQEDLVVGNPTNDVSKLTALQ